MFGGPSFQTYYLSVNRLVADCFRKESADYLLRVDFDEYLAHLIAKLSWQEMTWDEGAMTMETLISKVSTSDHRGVTDADHPYVRLRIPFQPHPQRRDFLRLMPSSYRSSGEPEWQFAGDTLVIETVADPGAIERAIDEVRYWFGTRNADVRAGNEQLKQSVAPIWKRKREELERVHGTLQALVEQVKIPLHQDPQAPKPVVVARPVPATSRPALKPGRAEPELDRLEGVRVEMSRVYREMESGKRDGQDGSHSQIAKVLENTEIERRLIRLESERMGNYLHRLEAVEDALGIKECGPAPCMKRVLAQLHAHLHGGEWAGCDDRPETFIEPRRRGSGAGARRSAGVSRDKRALVIVE